MMPSPLEMRVLSALQSGPQHGYDLVHATRQDSIWASLAEGFCYEAIYSSELRGWISASAQRQGGRRPRLYRLTPKGLRLLRMACSKERFLSLLSSR